MSPSKIFLYSCLSFIFGIFLSSFLKIPQILTPSLFILGIFFISFFWLNKKFIFFGFFILFLIFGILKAQFAFLKIEKNLAKDFFGKEVVLVGKVIEEPKLGEKTSKLIFLPAQRDFGKILITTKRYPQYQYGDELKISGVLEEPKNFDTFDYKNYLAKDGIFSLISFPEIEFLGNSGNPIKKFLFSFRGKLKEVLNKFLSPPQSGLMEALLFGDEEKISKEWKEKLNITGTRHITAVSGMNITIITFLLFNFLLFLGFWRNQAFYFSIILISFYILMIGVPASAIRAGIMALLFLTAQNLGRISNASRAIIFAAFFMLFLNPLLLKYDLGFQLSFLATFGLIYLQPIFQDFLKSLPNFLSLRSNLSATLGAQIFSLPILIYNFGKIPLISPLPNILILPLLPFLTIFGFFISIFGMVFYPFGYFLSLISWPLLTLILKIVDFFSKVPFSYLSIEKFSFFFILIFYLFLAIFIKKIEERRKLRFLGIMF